MKYFLCLASLLFQFGVYISVDLNDTLLTQYDQMICNNEPSCTLVTHFAIPEDERSLHKRDCMCDSDCREYLDCCYDSPFYKMSEQIQPPVYYCPPTINVYMKSNCPTTWTDDFVARQCAKSIQPLDNDDIMLILPVTNRDTRTTYGNAYCAYCHDDRNFHPWLLVPVCTSLAASSAMATETEAILHTPHQESRVVYDDRRPHPVSVLLRVNPLRGYTVEGTALNLILDIYIYQQHIDRMVDTLPTTPVPLSVYNEEGNSSRGETVRQQRQANPGGSHFSTNYRVPYDHAEVWKHAKFDTNNKRFVSFYDNVNFECQIGPKLPDDMRNVVRMCVPRVVDTCPPNADPVLAHYCRESTSITYNKYTKRAYRNKYCAFCNMELKAYLTGCPHKLEDAFFRSFQPSLGGLHGGVNPCIRPGAAKKLNCP